MHNGCDTRSAAVWTYRQRVAFVISVTDNGRPIQDSYKLQRLCQIMRSIMEAQTGAPPIVNFSMVKGIVHHERKLHQLMLLEEQHRWQQLVAQREAAVSASVNHGSPGSSTLSDQTSSALPMAAFSDSEWMETHGSRVQSAARDLDESLCAVIDDENPEVAPVNVRPDIEITYSPTQDYWIVLIKSKDRPKLLFDTVCTLADLNYDVFHGTIDSEETDAVQVRRPGLKALREGPAGRDLGLGRAPSCPWPGFRDGRQP